MNTSKVYKNITENNLELVSGNYNINIGRHYGGGYNFKGNMSDVRIYATALSADDVKTTEFTFKIPRQALKALLLQLRLWKVK